MIFVMELGDKTQLIILTLATRDLSAKKLALGAMAGFAVIVSIGGVIASLLSQLISLEWISVASGVVFIILGALQLYNTLKPRKETNKDENKLDEKHGKKIYERSKYSFLTGFIAIVSMELGDKTQIATILLASTSSSFIGTLIGSWIALSLLAVIGAFAGKWISEKLPKKAMDMISGLLFLGIGIIIILFIFL
ncbi:MAG: TMEM165/GDT1 family protein [Candidatus Hodarchaeota archaeon]